MNTKIRLQTSWLLNDRFKLNSEGLQEKFDAVLAGWNTQEEKVVEGLTRVTGLTFLRNYIDVFLINPDNAPSISFPVIVKIFDSVDKTVRVIIHELIHNLMWDNEQKDNWSKKVCEQYKEEPLAVARHVAVHAILEALYTDVLENPTEIEKDIEDCKNRPAYARAWEIVKKEGYRNIIKKLQS